MRVLLTLSLFSLSLQALAASDWKVVAETTAKCPKEVKIMAKEGEKFVKANIDGEEKTLQGSEGFSKDAPRETTFASSDVTFTNPGTVESNLPKVDIADSGVKHHCNLMLK